MKSLGPFLILLFFLGLTTCNPIQKGQEAAKSSIALKEVYSAFEIHLIRHGTLVLEWNTIVIYVDPIGEESVFKNQKRPDLILISDSDPNHFDIGTLQDLRTERAKIIVPQAVADKIPDIFTPQIDVLRKGDKKERFHITIEAIPQHTYGAEVIKTHEKTQGNRYLLEMGGERIYISGGTVQIPNKEILKAVDRVFICMDPPHSVSVDSLAKVLSVLQPKKIYPYCLRRDKGLQRARELKILLDRNPGNIEVILPQSF